jgi:hypothetical protein
MSEADRSGLAAAATAIASRVQSNDAAGLRAETVPEFASNFGAMQQLVGETAPRMKGAALTVEQLYLLNATEIKGGAGADAQFFCTLNASASSVDFLISGLTPGIYGFAIVTMTGAPSPMRISMLMRRDGGRWLLAGIYPKTAVAAGHDGLWYWKEARSMATAKQRWTAWLYYGQAEALLKPANFVSSTHLEKLRDEQRTAVPPALSGGIGPDTPLVVKGADGKEYQFTSLGTDDTLSKDKLDVVAHMKVDTALDPVATRKRNEDASRALLAAYPELRGSFHGVWMFSDVAGGTTFPTETAMADLH